LVEEFKRGMNGVIRRKLMEAENQPSSIEQWYRRAIALDWNWRESRREEKRLREKKEQGAPKQELQQILPRPLVWQRRQQPPQQVTTGPALIEGVKRTNAVVVRGQGQEIGTPRWDSYAMEVDKGGIAMHVEVLGTWPNIVEIREEEEWQREGGWNIEEEKSKELINNQTI